MLHTTTVHEKTPPGGESPYRERLVPGVMWWVIVSALIAMVAVAYGAALGAGTGFIVGAGLGLIAAVSLVRASPVIEVSADRIRCGTATLPRGSWGEPRLVRGDEMAQIRRGHDPGVGDRAYQVLPPWLGRSGVLVGISDPVDPHSAWLIATRRPTELASALSTRLADG